MITKKIEIGEEAFNKVLETGEYKQTLLSECQKYGIQYQTIRGYILQYINRVISPKPTERDIRRFRDIRGGNVVVRKAEDKSFKTQADISRKKVKEIIDKYLSSKDIFPDRIILYYYNSSSPVRSFSKSLESFSKDSSENKKDYDDFYQTMQERTNYLIDRISYILENYSLDKLTSFDIELETGIDSHTFAWSLNKKVIINRFGIENTTKLFNIVKGIPKSVKVYSFEEAKGLNISILGMQISDEVLKDIFAFLEEKGLKTTYNNLIYCARLTPITINESRGKEAYDLFLKANGNPHVFGEIVKEQGITIKDVLSNISLYRKRKYAPRPSEEDEKIYKLYVRRDNDNFINLDDIVSSLIFAESDKDLENVIKKYKYVAIKRSVDEYLLSKDNNQSDKNLLKEKFDRLCILLNNNQTAKDKDDKLLVVLNEYIDSSVIYPDSIALKYGMSPRLFEQRIEKSEGKESIFEQIKLYELVRSQRVNKYLERLKVLLAELSNKIDSLDAQIIMGMKMSELLICLSRKDTNNVINKNMANKLINYFRSISGSNKILTKEEASKIKYSYNGRKITPPDLDKIYSYLEENNLDATKSNIIFAFNKTVTGKIEKTILNKN